MKAKLKMHKLASKRRALKALKTHLKKKFEKDCLFQEEVDGAQH